MEPCLRVTALPDRRVSNLGQVAGRVTDECRKTMTFDPVWTVVNL